MITVVLTFSEFCTCYYNHTIAGLANVTENSCTNQGPQKHAGKKRVFVSPDSCELFPYYIAVFKKLNYTIFKPGSNGKCWVIKASRKLRAKKRNLYATLARNLSAVFVNFAKQTNTFLSVEIFPLLRDFEHIPHFFKALYC